MNVQSIKYSWFLIPTRVTNYYLEDSIRRLMNAHPLSPFVSATDAFGHSPILFLKRNDQLVTDFERGSVGFCVFAHLLSSEVIVLKLDDITGASSTGCLRIETWSGASAPPRLLQRHIIVNWE
jgi:hypothetical protein